MRRAQIFLAWICLILMGAVQPATAQVACGDIITDERVMTSTLSGCPDAPVLTIETGGSLDMNGFSIVPVNGGAVVMSGTGGRLKNGGITSCGSGAAGVRVTGDRNTIENISVRNCGAGFTISGIKNKLLRCVAKDNGIDGFTAFATASGTSINQAYAYGNGEAGFSIGGGAAKLTNLVAEQNRVGIFLNNSGKRLTEAVAFQNTQTGILASGPGAKLKRVVAIQNGSRGIWLQRGARMKQAIAIGNGDITFANIALKGDGVRVDDAISARGEVNYEIAPGDGEVAGQRLRRSLSVEAGTIGLRVNEDENRVEDNFFAEGDRAIEVTGGLNTLSGNAAANSLITPTFVDTTGCATNVWKDNAGSSDPCID